MTTKAALRNHVWQACTAIRNEHRDVKKYVEYTAVLLFFKFYDDLYDTLPDDVRKLIPDQYRWTTLRNLDVARGFAGYNPEVLIRFREFFEERKWRGKGGFGVIFENFTFDIKHDEVLGKALIALDRIDFAGLDYDQKGDLYEFLIGKMADAGVKGEFFTPRAIVNMIIDLLHPKPGQRVWDPACGTAGFLTRSFEVVRSDIDGHLTGEEHKEALTFLRASSLYGCETEAVSARLARMNMLLRGDGHSTILEFNSLDSQTYRQRRLELRGDRVRNPLPDILETGFDLIMANPPYGGSQAVSDVGTVLKPWTRTRKPEANFLQVMMHSLAPGGRCGVVMPEGILFRREEAPIRERLLRDYDLQAVVGLFQGAFEFAEVKACVVFFRKPRLAEAWAGTKQVWIVDTQTMEDIALVPQHFGVDTDQGRMVTIDEIEAHPPHNLRPRYYLAIDGGPDTMGATLGELFEHVKDVTILDDDTIYKQVTIKVNGNGATLRGEVRGGDVATKRQFRVAAGDLVISKIDARHGAYALIPEELDGGVVSADFPVYRRRDNRLDADLFGYYLRYGQLVERFVGFAQGSTNRQRVSTADIESVVLPVPDAETQEQVLRRLDQQAAVLTKAEALLEDVATFRWLDEAVFEVGDHDVVAETFAPLVEDASDYVAPALEPDSVWQLYSLTNREGVKLGEKKRGSDFHPTRKYKRVVENAVTYDTRRVNVGSIGIMPAGDDHAIMSPYRVMFRCLPGLDPRFVFYTMKSPFFLERVRDAQIGAVRDELFFKVFTDIPMRVPTLPCQLQVISHIEEQLAAYQRVQAIADQAEATIRTIVAAQFAQALTPSAAAPKVARVM
jgi:type I restriction enzyme M protein